MNDLRAELRRQLAMAIGNRVVTLTANATYWIADAVLRVLHERRLEVVRALYPDSTELLRDLGGWAPKPRIINNVTRFEKYEVGFVAGTNAVWVFPKGDA